VIAFWIRRGISGWRFLSGYLLLCMSFQSAARTRLVVTGRYSVDGQSLISAGPGRVVIDVVSHYPLSTKMGGQLSPNKSVEYTRLPGGSDARYEGAAHFNRYTSKE